VPRYPEPDVQRPDLYGGEKERERTEVRQLFDFQVGALLGLLTVFGSKQQPDVIAALRYLGLFLSVDAVVEDNARHVDLQLSWPGRIICHLSLRKDLPFAGRIKLMANMTNNNQ
jgi:hypothetical protein